MADFPVRLQGGNNPTEGRVEIFYNGKWGLVCANGWDRQDAIVVCQENNLGNNGTVVQISYNQTETLWLSGVDCVGNEPHLSFCSHNGIGVVEMHKCIFVAGMVCFGKTLFSYSEL